jgi:hypothetical protein
MDDTKQYSGSGEIKMNPLGPHFYVDVDVDEKPGGMVDLVTNVMNDILLEMDENDTREINHEHIRGHETITTIEWEHNPDSSYNIDFDVEDFDIDESWYSESKLRVYNEFGEIEEP